MAELKPKEMAEMAIRKNEDPDGFIVDIIPPKGRGVRAVKKFRKGEFLMLYSGQLISEEEGEKRENESDSVFRYFFHHKGKGYCIDATEEPTAGPSLGRLVNHGTGKIQNCAMRCIESRKVPYLCLFATKHINPGDELLYDYGRTELPWISNNSNTKKQVLKKSSKKPRNRSCQKSAHQKSHIQHNQKGMQLRSRALAKRTCHNTTQERSCTTSKKEATAKLPQSAQEKTIVQEAEPQFRRKVMKKEDDNQQSMQTTSRMPSPQQPITSQQTQQGSSPVAQHGVIELAYPGEHDHSQNLVSQSLLSSSASQYSDQSNKTSQMSSQPEIDECVSSARSTTDVTPMTPLSSLSGLPDQLQSLKLLDPSVNPQAPADQLLDSREGFKTSDLPDVTEEVAQIFPIYRVFIPPKNNSCEIHIRKRKEAEPQFRRKVMKKEDDNQQSMQTTSRMPSPQQPITSQQTQQGSSPVAQHGVIELAYPGEHDHSQNLVSQSLLSSSASQYSDQSNKTSQMSSQPELDECVSSARSTTDVTPMTPLSSLSGLPDQLQSLKLLDPSVNPQGLADQLLDSWGKRITCGGYGLSTVTSSERDDNGTDLDVPQTSEPDDNGTDLEDVPQTSEPDDNGIDLDVPQTGEPDDNGIDLDVPQLGEPDDNGTDLEDVPQTSEPDDNGIDLDVPQTGEPDDNGIDLDVPQLGEPDDNGAELDVPQTSEPDDNGIDLDVPQTGEPDDNGIDLDVHQTSDSDDNGTDLDVHQTSDSDDNGADLDVHQTSDSDDNGTDLKDSDYVPEPNDSFEDDTDSDWEESDYVPETDSGNDGTDREDCDSIEIPVISPHREKENVLNLCPALQGKKMLLQQQQDKLLPVSDSTITSSVQSVFEENQNDLGSTNTSQVVSSVKDTGEDAGNTDEREINCEVTSSGDEITVHTANNQGQRRWDKKHCCIFCMKQYPKLPRHMEDMHSTELEVAAILALPKYSTERKLKWDYLRNRGNYIQNTKVLKAGKGKLTPCRRPSSEADSGIYIPCNNCFAFFTKANLWRHLKNCRMKKSSSSRKAKPHEHQRVSAALLPVSTEASQTFRHQVLDTMHNDQTSLAVRQDRLIIIFGTKLFAKNGHIHQHQYIKAKLREVGRFLEAMRELDQSVQTLTECIDPTKFKTVVKAVKKVSGYNEKDGKYKTPSLALKLGHSLKKCANYLKSEALQSQDTCMKEKAEGFHELCNVEWSSQVSSQALTTLHVNKYNKPKRIPLTRDLKRLNQYLQAEATKLGAILESNADEKTWRAMAEVSLAQLTLFNRRRGGEMERLTVNDYQRGICNSSEAQGEVVDSLSLFERELLKTMSRVEMRGKKGTKVAVLLTQNHKSQIELLIKTRSVGKIRSGNEYLFPRARDCKTPIRCSDVLRKYAAQCGAEKPDFLRSTALRKHVALVTQVLNLKKNELDVLARFLGHDIRVHREYYRLPEDTIEIAKISKLLINLERGTLQKFKGMSLDDIVVSEDEVIPECEQDETGELEDEVPKEKEREEAGRQSSNVASGTYSSPHAPKDTSSERRPWSTEEKAAVLQHLDHFIRQLKCPGKRDCERAIAADDRLKQRSWKHIKFYVKNQIDKQKRAR